MVILVLRHKSKLNFFFFKNKNKFWGYDAVVATREDFSINVSFTTVGLILSKLGRFLILGYGPTDKVLESSYYGNMPAQQKNQLKIKMKVIFIMFKEFIKNKFLEDNKYNSPSSWINQGVKQSSTIKIKT